MNMPNQLFRGIQANRLYSQPYSPSRSPGVLPASRVGTWHSVTIFTVKFIHSLIFLSVAASILHIFYAGITNRSSRLTKLTLMIALGESVVFAANSWRCPLTQLAEHLGAEEGQVTDIFLPRWFADRIPWFFTPPLITGILALLYHRRRATARNANSDVRA